MDVFLVVASAVNGTKILVGVLDLGSTVVTMVDAANLSGTVVAVVGSPDLSGTAVPVEGAPHLSGTVVLVMVLWYLVFTSLSGALTHQLRKVLLNPLTLSSPTAHTTLLSFLLTLLTPTIQNVEC